ncbi:hypothetical protein Glove_194g108 [Diversispora epigaea]|uniref:Uncharacterized protein n=1 Tax=Diversispora epigaea TaxID=1348612 RepID=A0A397IUF4_9GLOM|nr:hypothetical protein Glove_194g108 [Diversispora epigaea]
MRTKASSFMRLSNILKKAYKDSDSNKETSTTNGKNNEIDLMKSDLLGVNMENRGKIPTCKNLKPGNIIVILDRKGQQLDISMYFEKRGRWKCI